MAQPRRFAALLAAGALAGCAAQPPLPFGVQVPDDVGDARGRYGEILCTVLEQRATSLPDHRPCGEALSPVRDTPRGDGRPVDLGYSQRRLAVGFVGGIGFGCLADWLRPPVEVSDYLRPLGYDLSVIEVDALSGSTHNARQVRDAVMAMPAEPGPPRLVLIGYSKGAPDILEAVVSYPEIRGRIAAVVSVAGAVGGSPVAEHASEREADLLSRLPGADCGRGDGEAVASLRTDVRRRWLEAHPLPAELRYYSVVTLPEPARVSRALEPTYRRIGRLDPRNDGQLIYSDQFVPGSTLLAFVNADHWAVALPIARAHPLVGRLFVDRNDYPREALLEAVLRYVEEDLATASR